MPDMKIHRSKQREREELLQDLNRPPDPEITIAIKWLCFLIVLAFLIGLGLGLSNLFVWVPK